DVSYSIEAGFAQLDFSQTGTMIYQSGTAGGDLVTVQWLDDTGKMKPLLAKPGAYRYPELSPDGGRLALITNDAARPTVSVYDLQGDHLMPIISGGIYNQPVWTPDGRYILARGSSEGMFWTRSVGGGKTQPILQSKNVRYPRSFTPDGKRLAFEEVVVA